MLGSGGGFAVSGSLHWGVRSAQMVVAVFAGLLFFFPLFPSMSPILAGEEGGVLFSFEEGRSPCCWEALSGSCLASLGSGDSVSLVGSLSPKRNRLLRLLPLSGGSAPFLFMSSSDFGTAFGVFIKPDC